MRIAVIFLIFDDDGHRIRYQANCRWPLVLYSCCATHQGSWESALLAVFKCTWWPDAPSTRLSKETALLDPRNEHRTQPTDWVCPTKIMAAYELTQNHNVIVLKERHTKQHTSNNHCIYYICHSTGTKYIEPGQLHGTSRPRRKTTHLRRHCT